MLSLTRRTLVVGALLTAAAVGAPATIAAAAPMRIALGDIASVETLNFLIAVERAKERGVDATVTAFNSEDTAAQAVVSGQADIGVGVPYALLQKVKAPIRLFYQMSNLRFFPVVNTDFYKTWKDLNGQEIAVQGRGSGSEALMAMMAKREGITYGNISYVPGSEVRAAAMLQGNIKATIVDSPNWHLLQEKGGGKFALLPMEGVDATDEALYANTDYLAANAGDVQILVEELLKTWKEIGANPAAAAELRTKYKLLPDLPADLQAEIVPYYQESVEAGMFPQNGGSETAARADFDFYSVAGQLEGNAADLKVEDFWTFEPLTKARQALGL